MTHITCRLTAKNRDQLRNPTLGNRVWAFYLCRSIKRCCDPPICLSVCHVTSSGKRRKLGLWLLQKGKPHAGSRTHLSTEVVETGWAGVIVSSPSGRHLVWIISWIHVRRVCRCGRRRAGLRSENVPRVRFADSGELRQRKRSGEVRLRSTVSSSDLSANCQPVAARWFGRQLFQTRLRSPGNTRRRNRRPLHRRSWYTGEFQPARRRYERQWLKCLGTTQGNGIPAPLIIGK